MPSPVEALPLSSGDERCLLWEETKQGSNAVSCHSQERPAYAPRAPRLGEESRLSLRLPVQCWSTRWPCSTRPHPITTPERDLRSVPWPFEVLMLKWHLASFRNSSRASVPPQGTQDDHMGQKHAATSVASTQWTTHDLHRGDKLQKRGVPDALRPHGSCVLRLCPVSGASPRRAAELCCPSVT